MEKISFKRSIKVKILSIVLLCVFLVTIILGYLSFEFSKQRIVAMLGDSIKGIAITIANFISPQDIALILTNSEGIKGINERARGGTIGLDGVLLQNAAQDTGSVAQSLDRIKSVYDGYSRLLGNVKRSNSIDSPINIYIASGGLFRVVLTSEPTILIGASYSIGPQGREALRSQSAQVTGIYKDKDGVWISAYAPGGSIQPQNQRILVEISYKIDSYLARLRDELTVIIAICILGFLTSGFLSYRLINPVVLAIKSLDGAAVGLEKGHYDEPIEARTDDEIGHLAMAFEFLRVSIKKKIEELRISLTREKKAHLESLVALTNAIEMRDPYTKEHVGRVEEYAMLIAKAMHLSHNDMIQLKYSCFLHDVGKIYIDDSILKKGKLTGKDFEEIKKHSEQGARIIEGIQYLTAVKEAVLYHQERYDGKGYPKGLKGSQIPLLARIVSVADAFDAMTTDRPYKQKMSFKQAMNEIEKNSGTQFDPDVCQALLRYRDTLEEMALKRFPGAL